MLRPWSRGTALAKAVPKPPAQKHLQGGLLPGGEPEAKSCTPDFSGEQLLPPLPSLPTQTRPQPDSPSQKHPALAPGSLRPSVLPTPAKGRPSPRWSSLRTARERRWPLADVGPLDMKQSCSAQAFTLTVPSTWQAPHSAAPNPSGTAPCKPSILVPFLDASAAIHLLTCLVLFIVRGSPLMYRLGG